MMAERHETLVGERYPFIAVVGAPGSGKSSLIDAFVEHTNVKRISEPFEENPYLDGFYTKDPKQYAFDAQMFFLRVRGLQMQKVGPVLANEAVIQDSTFDADVVMAGVLRNMCFISERDYLCYLSAKEKIGQGLRKPDLTIFTKASKKTVDERIIKRGRSMELTMLEKHPDYFSNLVDGFDDYLKEQELSGKGLVVIDTEKFNINDEPDSRIAAVRECSNWLAYYLTVTHEKGLNGIGSDGVKLIMPGFFRPPTRDYSQTFRMSDRLKET